MTPYGPKKGHRASFDDKLAFLALTHTIDQWNSKYPHLASQLLDDIDQQLLSECYAAHLMPVARSFWWNGDNAHRAKTQLLYEKYPLIKAAAWKRNGDKARDILRIWRKDAALLYTALSKNGGDDDVSVGKADEEVDEETEDGPGVSPSTASEDEAGESDEEAASTIVVAINRDTKREADGTLGRVEAPKKARKCPMFDEESSEDETFEIRHRSNAKPTTSTPKRAVAAMITPPQSGESTPAIRIDSDTEDEDPIAMRKYQGRRGRRRRRVEPEGPANTDTAVVDTAPLTFTLIQTMVSTEPAEAPTQKHNCLAALSEAVGLVVKSRDTFSIQERREASRQLKKLEKKLKNLSKTIKILNKAVQH
ncbi:hypothetical protein CI238_00847 [Colletotrichum incanum]|uniref:Uncharacterized protein n=1 Tax=Colletotrichum incanum TaxID=1573173 RepID=A0A161YHD2_COLIC|nr:hypothetical protein CI238_00847 [Colletotrichum incanum]OHW99574.1 hypothetical protein CSPAE12_01727 [Colletotrichum incanum]